MKSCVVCKKEFEGRADKKTCSQPCRKKLSQRLKRVQQNEFICNTIRS